MKTFLRCDSAYGVREDKIYCFFHQYWTFLPSFKRGKAFSTIKMYLVAISSCHMGFNGETVGKYPIVSRFMKGVRRLRPITRPDVTSMRSVPGPGGSPFWTLGACGVEDCLTQDSFIARPDLYEASRRVRWIAYQPCMYQIYTTFPELSGSQTQHSCTR